MPYADPVKNRECVNRYKREHKDEINARTRELRASDPERFRNHTRRYLAKLDPDVKRKRKHETYRRKAKHIAESKRWRKNNLEKSREFHRKWSNKNPEKCSHDRNIRRARLRNATVGDTIVIQKWEKSWRDKQKAKCFWCKETFPSKYCVVDHVVSLSRGGEHSIGNLCISCRRCNSIKHAMPLSLWNDLIAEPSLV